LPIFPVGCFVWVFSDGDDYFILGNFLHVGNADEQTLAMVQNDAGTQQIVGAVFR